MTAPRAPGAEGTPAIAKIETLYVKTPSGGDNFENASVSIGNNAVLTVNYTHQGERLRKHYSPSGVAQL